MNDWPNIIGIPLWVWIFGFPIALAVFAAFRPHWVSSKFRPLWSVLDRAYTASGYLAALFMCIILLITIGQMGSRWIGITFEGSTEFAGYAMAATSFFALAHALAHGSHIRVSVFLNLNNWTRYWLNVFALGLSAVVATYFARFAVKTNKMSAMLNDRTQGQDQIPDYIAQFLQLLGTAPDKWGVLMDKATGEMIYTPMWVPQLTMSIGTILLAICLWDHLIRLVATKTSQIRQEVLE
ncbi:MAG: TRAP transporter small permease [Gammaproteobacteria bacterium]|jgi:TRAP-type C4-dicarboxylate transport system permease small subunit|nr:TRAP transporter small permease [Gammaproteobacteria bacterium]